MDVNQQSVLAHTLVELVALVEDVKDMSSASCTTIFIPSPKLTFLGL